MVELLKYMTSGFWVFTGSTIVFILFLKFILKLLQLFLWTKREYIEENERLKSKIESLEDELDK